MAGHPKEAVTAFAAAYKLAGTAFPHQSVKILLELSDAQRRAGNEALAVAALEGRGQGCRRCAPFWPVDGRSYPLGARRLHAARDRGLDRIGHAIAAKTNIDRRPDIGKRAQSRPIVGQRGDPVGDDRRMAPALRRGSRALVAFKHAEGFATDENSHDRLQIGEARALAAMGQRASAVAILTRLAENSNPEIAQPALAVYGSLLFNEGQTTQALARLRRRSPPARPGRKPRPTSVLLA